ncbi:GNAT family N-acetyltransferase [Bacillus weihaiensis]|uniref:GNAT family N-acetyltransferase n=1 Tax=Bacillus weihaiensis TaxID=1547283 RepID=UPI002353E9F2|nr:GNAT family N-acetyltransferase [Bacillus weihaiensis]
MVIRAATASDSAVIHDVMMKAFEEYKNETPPSSALEETIQSVSDALEKGEKALIAFDEDEPVGMVRFQVKKEDLYFYRLSVLPKKQGDGIGKKIVRALEEYASRAGVSTIRCKVRLTVPKNLNLYSSIGYITYDEEVLMKPNGVEIKVISMKKVLSAFKEE